MYVIRLNKKSTPHPGVYLKHAIIVSTDFDEYCDILHKIEVCNARLRRRHFTVSNNITSLVPNNGSTWLIYVEYRHTEDGDWEHDITNIFNNISPRKRSQKVVD